MDLSALFDPKILSNVGGTVLQAQVAHYFVAFVIAWKLVRRDMAKDLEKQFQTLSSAMHAIEDRLTEVIKNLNTRVTALENQTKKGE